MNLQLGAREPQVEEPLSGSQSILIEFELDEVAEPKALSSQNLRKLVFRYGSHRKVAIKIGASEAFVRQKCSKRQPSSINSK